MFLLVSRRMLLVRRMLACVVALAAVLFLLKLVAHGPDVYGDSCIGEKALNLPSQSRLDGYCNPSTELQDDSFEGQPPDCLDRLRYELVQVIAVLRHGDRAPLLDVVDLGGPQDFECGLRGVQWDVLEQVTVRALKGKRDKVTYPLHPGKSGQRCRSGSLTAKGFEQHRVIGDLFQQRYLDTGLLKTLGKPVSNKDLGVFVRSTGLPRCMQSAAAFLAGMHQTTDAEVLTHSDTWFRRFPQQLAKRKGVELYESDGCEAAANRQRTAVRQSKAYLEASQTYFEPSMATLGEWLGEKRSSLPDVTYLCDVLQNEHCRGKKEFCHERKSSESPLNSGKRCLQTRVVNTALEACDKAFSLNYSLPYARIIIQPLLEQIILHMEDVLGNDVDPSQTIIRQMFLYFGHDSTLIPLLTSLGVFDEQLPPLASRVTFELWRCTSSPHCQQHKVRLLYNGRPLQGDLTNTMGFCGLGDLQNLVARRQLEVRSECST